MYYPLSDERCNTKSNFNVTIDFIHIFFCLIWLSEPIPNAYLL